MSMDIPDSARPNNAAARGQAPKTPRRKGKTVDMDAMGWPKGHKVHYNNRSEPVVYDSKTGKYPLQKWSGNINEHPVAAPPPDPHLFNDRRT